jgi:hypothetical protein
VVKEESFDAMLNEVCPIVTAAHVSQFMAQYVLGRFGTGIRWQKNNRLKKPQNHRRSVVRRNPQRDVAAQANVLAKREKERIQFGPRSSRIQLQLANAEKLPNE